MNQATLESRIEPTYLYCVAVDGSHEVEKMPASNVAKFIEKFGAEYCYIGLIGILDGTPVCFTKQTKNIDWRTEATYQRAGVEYAQSEVYG